MTENFSSDSFEESQWSLISQVRSGENQIQREALQKLLSQYLPVLRSHLARKHRLSDYVADDLIQGFVLKNIIEGDLVKRADPTAGKFRSWIIKWLDNYVRHELSKRKRETPGDDIDYVFEDQADRFDVDWARKTLAEAAEVMFDECIEGGNQVRWRVFQMRLLNPLESHSPPLAYDRIVKMLKLESKAQAQNHLVSGKRHFQRSLEKVVGRYVGSERDITQEITELGRVLTASRIPEEGAETDCEQSMTPGDMNWILRTAPERLAKLFSMGIAMVWTRCLATQVTQLTKNNADYGLPDNELDLTVGELFTQDSPSEELLVKLKQFGYSLIHKESEEWPVDIGLGIYLTAIATANARLGKWISQAPVETLASGFEFLIESGWLDEETMKLYEESCAAV